VKKKKKSLEGGENGKTVPWEMTTKMESPTGKEGEKIATRLGEQGVTRGGETHRKKKIMAPLAGWGKGERDPRRKATQDGLVVSERKPKMGLPGHD